MRLVWVPASAMRPWSSTTIWSALRTVERRWAMVIVVRPSARVSNAFWTARSVSVSSALVASFPHCGVQQVGLLADHAHDRGEVGEPDVADVDAVDADAAAGGVVEPGDQRGEGGLA